jgi:hypothetical protein
VGLADCRRGVPRAEPVAPRTATGPGATNCWGGRRYVALPAHRRLGQANLLGESPGAGLVALDPNGSRALVTRRPGLARMATTACTQRTSAEVGAGVSTQSARSRRRCLPPETEPAAHHFIEQDAYGPEVRVLSTTRIQDVPATVPRPPKPFRVTG